ncbi:MAG: N-formylglutamate amidohydrolase [Candidatus Heimdallarchaeota archaeon]
MNEFEENATFPQTIPNSIQGYIFLKGRNNILLSAPHSQGPSADNFTGEIAFRVGKKTESGVIAATISRERLDYNRASARNSPFRFQLKEEVFRLQKKFQTALLLDIHGVAARPAGPSVYVGTQFGRTASPRVIDLILDAFWSVDVDAVLASLGDPSLMGGDIVGSLGNPMEGRHCVQLEIDQRHRSIGFGEEIIRGLLSVVKRWEETFPTAVGISAILHRLRGVRYPIDSLETLILLLSRGGNTISISRSSSTEIEELRKFMEAASFPIPSSRELMRALAEIWPTIRAWSKIP